MKGMYKINLSDKTINDSRLTYDKKENKYYLCLSYQQKLSKQKDKIRVVALDCGEKIFQTYYSEIGYGFIGKNIRNNILPLEKKIRRYQRI